MKRTLFFCLLLIAMLFHADFVTEGAKSGLLLWYTSVVPALFPFMVLSGLIVSGGAVSAIMRPFYHILHPLLGISEAGCYTLVSGLLCGYPMGAKTCADFLKSGQISAREGKFLMAICNHPSPMFLLGYVWPFFAGRIPLARLLTAVYAPVVVLAILARLIYRPGCPHRKHYHNDPAIPTGSPRVADSSPSPASANTATHTANTNSLTADAAILSAIEVLCKIGGYLMLYSIAIVFLHHAGFVPHFVKLSVIAALEMTTGIRELASALALPAAGAAICAALTFGGCSGISQTQAVIRDADGMDGKLSIAQYCIWKLLHAGLSAAVFLVIH